MAAEYVIEVRRCACDLFRVAADDHGAAIAAVRAALAAGGLQQRLSLPGPGSAVSVECKCPAGPSDFSIPTLAAALGSDGVPSDRERIAANIRQAAAATSTEPGSCAEILVHALEIAAYDGAWPALPTAATLCERLADLVESGGAR